jgi:hypothetical protein
VKPLSATSHQAQNVAMSPLLPVPELIHVFAHVAAFFALYLKK